MPEQEVKYFVKIEKSGSGAGDAVNDLKKVETQSTTTNAALGGLTKGFGTLFAALGGLSILKDGIAEFVEAEKAMSKLNVALASSEQALPGVAESMKALAQSLAQTSSFDSSSVLNVISKLLTFGAKTQDVERLSRAVLDLSTLLDRDLGKATLAVGQGLKGDLGVFKSLGIQVDETKSSVAQFNEALREMEKRVGGQSAAAINTMGGQLDQLGKKWKDLKQALGGIGLGALTAAGILKEPETSGNQPWLNPALPSTNAVPNFKELEMPAVAAAGRNMFQFLPRYSVGQNDIRTPEMEKADDEATQKSTEAWLASTAKKMRAELDALDKVAAERERLADLADKQSLDQMGNVLAVNATERELTEELMLSKLDGIEKERAQLESNHERRKQQIRELTFDDEERYTELIALEENLTQVERGRFEHAQTFSGKLEEDFKRIAVAGTELFSQGLAGAIVDSFEEGGKAFQKFAAQFFKTMAKMILQAIILRVVQGAVGGLFGGGSTSSTLSGSGGGGLSGINSVGAGFTPMAGGGMAETSGPVTLPRFGVLAGEAGRELLTVMARPRAVNIGGLSAHVGSVAGRTMAITDANALARGGAGAGGLVSIHVSMEPGLRGEIVQDSIKGAQVQITQDLSRDTPIKRGVRSLAS